MVKLQNHHVSTQSYNQQPEHSSSLPVMPHAKAPSAPPSAFLSEPVLSPSPCQLQVVTHNCLQSQLNTTKSQQQLQKGGKEVSNFFSEVKFPL